MVKRVFRWVFWLLPLVVVGGWAQVVTTTISDTVYRADGTGAGGEIMVSWPAFSASGRAVPAGKLGVTIGAGGAVSFALAPNAGAEPAGTYYTVQYHLNDGTVSTEYWTVPAAGPTMIAAVRSQVVPATVAVQSASVSFVNDSINAALTGFLPLSGGTLTGPLYLDGDPQGALEAADKHYVDASVASLSGASGTAISALPGAQQTVVQPAGTTLEVNNLENVLYAQTFQSGTGSNGINNAENQPVCLTGGCLVTADPGYTTADAPQGLFYPACNVHTEDPYQASTCGFAWPMNSRLWDQRGGTDFFAYSNPRRTSITSPYPPDDARSSLGNSGLARAYIYDFDAGQGNAQLVPELHVMNQFAGGHNSNFGSLGGGTKSNLIGTLFETHFFSQGQHFIAQENGYCTGLGDCMVHPWQMYTSVGISRPSDEGTHWGDKVMKEDPHVFNGVCSTGCTAGSTALAVTAANGSNGEQGEGRFLIDITKASAGGEAGAQVVNGAGSGNHLLATAPVMVGAIYSVTAGAGAFTPSTAGGVLASNVPAATGSYSPGVASATVTLSQGAFSGSGVLCAGDGDSFEIAGVTAAGAVTGGSQTVTANWVRPHPAGAYVFQGGVCGQFLSINADTTLPNTGYAVYDTIRRAIPLVGSPNATTAYYWQPDIAFSNYPGGANNSAFANRTVTGATASYSNGVVTVTGSFGFTEAYNANANGNPGLGNITGQSVTISGASDASFDGTFQATVVNGTTFTYVPQNAPASASATGLAVNYCNCSFTLYPGAEVLGVYDQASKQVNGTLTLGANNVAWAAGDQLEEPHWHEMNLENSHNFISMYQPVSKSWGLDGPSYGGHATGDLRGWNVYNIAPQTQYLGFGGTLAPPAMALDTEGWWNYGWSLSSAPNEAVIRVGCKPTATVNGASVGGCGSWDASYYVLENQAVSGTGTLAYAPGANNYSFAGTNGRVTIGDNIAGGAGLQVSSVSGSPAVISLTGSGAALTVSGTGAGVITPQLTLTGSTAVTAVAGNSGKLATVAGGTAAGDCARFDANGNLVDGGAACGSSGGAGGAQAPGGSAGQVQVNNGSGGFSGVNTTGTGNVVLANSPALNGAVNINTQAGATNTTVIGFANGSATSSTTFAGFVNFNSAGATNFNNGISVQGPALYGGDAFFTPTATATAAAPFAGSNRIGVQGSVYSGGTVCTVNAGMQLTAGSSTAGTLTFGPAQQCNGTAVTLGADFTGAFQTVTVPHVLSSNNGKAMTLTAGAGVTAAWTAGTTHTDSSGSVTVTVGSGSVAAGSTLATVEFGTAWGSAPNCVFSPESAAAVGAAFVAPAGVGGFGWTSAGVVPAGAVLVFGYVCGG